jgi:hypothetical protein
VNLPRLLESARADRWAVTDLPWEAPVPALSAVDRATAVRYFVDMAGVERLAAGLFAEQARRAEDLVLREILETFVRDEDRHAAVAEGLAARYAEGLVPSESPALAAFAPACVDAARDLPSDVANLAVTLGELVLDTALLRAVRDRIDDPVLKVAMARIDKDESRHIAVDHHLVAVGLPDGRSLGRRIRGVFSLLRLGVALRPFLREVTFGTMGAMDPTRRRLREAFQRFQRLDTRPAGVRPVARVLLGMTRAALRMPRVAAFVLGMPPDAFPTA